TIYTFPDSFFNNNPAAAAVTSIKDRYGNTVSISRDGNGNKTQIASPNGRFIQFQHDSNNRITQATDNLGRTVTYIYDSYSASGRPTCSTQGALCAVIDANDGVTSFTYDGGDRMLTATDPRGYTRITNNYDPTSGRVATQTLADGTSTYQFSYTPASGNPITQTTITDPNLNVEVKSFDGNGFLAGDVLGSGSGVQQTFNYTRDPNTELVTSMTDQLGRETTYGYDANGNLTNVTKLAGTQQAVSTTLVYDPTFSQLTSITDPLSHAWTFGRDGSGNLTGITDPLNHSINLTYDAEGRPLTVADAYNDTAQFGYSGADLTSITDPLGNTTTRYTDYAGRPFAIKDGLGQFTGIIWDARDRITQITDPNSNATSFAYDGNSNLLSVTDAKTNQTSYSYDSRNRPTSRTDGLRVSESYGWDANSNLTSHIDRREKVTAFQYDALNRRTFAGFGQSGSNYESTMNYTWDAGNRMTQAADSIAGTITRAPDLLDRLTSETTPQGSISYSYDNANRRQTMQVAGQPQVVYGWDNANRLTGITQGSSSVGINYDNANRRTSLTLPNGVTVGYSFDSDSRITGLTYSAGSSQLGNLTYGYDADGRVITKGGTLAAIALPTSVSGNTFNADNGMTAFGGAPLSYDANGNLTSDGTNTYTWDARNHLMAISGAASASFTYDSFGRRASKSIGPTTTQFLYDWLNPVQELQGGGPSANLLTGLRIDEYLARTDSSNNVSTLLTDALGSTIGLVGSGQSIATTYTYEPFGATTVAGAANGNSYQFTGRENDGTGPYFYRARYYQPTFQRFIAQDPIGFRGGNENLYGYGLNDPTNAVDPTGLWTFSIGFTGNYQIGNVGNGTFSIQLAVDGSGNVALTVTGGGGLSGMVGGDQASGGLSIGLSNAKTVCDLSGPFGNFNIGGGAEVGGSLTTFGGPSPDGNVGGVNLTLGEGSGLGYGSDVTGTDVIPLFNLGSVLGLSR
ncbi:MAG: RHS repeat-associated core domain-containing protein, partial [Candidatus Binatus sp.]